MAADGGRPTALRGRILHCAASRPPPALEYLEDGVLLARGGRIEALMPSELAAAKGIDLSGCQPLPEGALLVPGFIDTHVHAPQLDVMASHGEQLLAWLERYTFPAEARFADAQYAQTAMAEFLDHLLAHGTTTAMVYSTSHLQATEALFTAAESRGMCLIAGKVLMDRHAPDALRDDTEGGIADSRSLIERWHGHGRLAYAVTPRFAVTSSPQQLAGAARLMADYPSVYLQTHLSENSGEIERVAELFPDASSYFDVYEQHGLCGPRAVFGHCLHLSDQEVDRMVATSSRVAFCPSSNLFLGSGLFDWARFRAAGVPVTLATDVGAGDSLSMLAALADAYKVCQLQGDPLTPATAFYTVTLGNARALSLEDRVGNLAPGSDADFVVLAARDNPLLERRLRRCRSIEEEWFALMMLGDDRLIRETWVQGRRVYRAEAT